MTVIARPDAPVTGLILSGGGARAAYQVGVLSAIADLLPDASHNPFPVIVGTSAGAINAVSLACGALQFGEAVRRLTTVWQGFHTHMVYRSDWPGVLRQASSATACSVWGAMCRWPCSTVRHCASCWSASWISLVSRRRCVIASCVPWR